MFQNKRFIAYLIYACLLIGFPLKMIINQNSTFNEGTAYKFKCQPLDPNDPFRGKFVRLAFEDISTPIGPIPSNGKAYGVIKVDDEGFASIDRVVMEYDETLPLVEVLFHHSTDITNSYVLPFDRLYMNEEKAGPAETLYRNALRDSNMNVYAKVFIAEGRFLLDNVYVDDVKLSDAVEVAEK